MSLLANKIESNPATETMIMNTPVRYMAPSAAGGSHGLLCTHRHRQRSADVRVPAFQRRGWANLPGNFSNTAHRPDPA